MTAQMLLTTLRQRRVELWVAEGRRRYRAPRGALTTADKTALAAVKEELAVSCPRFP